MIEHSTLTQWARAWVKWYRDVWEEWRDLWFGAQELDLFEIYLEDWDYWSAQP